MHFKSKNVNFRRGFFISADNTNRYEDFGYVEEFERAANFSLLIIIRNAYIRKTKITYLLLKTGLNQLLWYFSDLERKRCYILPNGEPDWENRADSCMKWRGFAKYVY